MNRKRGALCISASIAIIATVIYWGSLTGPFMIDDYATIVHNFALRDLNRLPQLVSQNFYYWAGEESSYFRPLTHLTFALEYQLWGLNPTGYRLTNVSLHIINGILVFFLVQRWVSLGAALVVSLLFVVHPVNVHPVANISARGDLLFFFFAVLTVYLWTTNRAGLRPLCLVFFFFGLFSKELAIVTPALILLADLTRGHSLAAAKATLRNRWGWYVGFAAVFLLYLTLRAWLLGHPLLMEIERGGSFLAPWQRLLLAGKLLGKYSLLLLLPIDLAFHHAVSIPRSIFDYEVLGPALFLILLGCLGARLWHRDRTILFGLGWFLIGLLPVLQFTLLNFPMMESWLYLPAIGFFIFSAALGTAFLKNDSIRFTAAILIVLLLGIRSSLRSADWADPTRLFEKNVLLYPQSHPAWVDLSQAYLDQGRAQEAIKILERAVMIAPRLWRPHLLLAKAYFASGEDEKAERELRAVLRIRPKNAWARQQLGILYFSSGHWQKANEEFLGALAGIPPLPTLYHLIGSAYLALGETRPAEAAFEKAMSERSLSKEDHGQVHADLGLLLKKKGYAVDSQRELSLALRFHPGSKPDQQGLKMLR